MTIYHKQDVIYKGNKYIVYFWDLDEVEVFPQENDYLYVRTNFFEKFFDKNTYQ